MRGSRLNPGSRGAVALAAVAAFAAIAAAIGAWSQRPVVEPTPDLPVASGVAHHSSMAPPSARPPGRQSGGRAPALDPAVPATSTAGGLIVVSMIGRVAHPGLVSLPSGARVADAVHAAGDVVAGTDLHGLNLARRLEDGEQLDIGAVDPAANGATGAAASSGGAGSSAGSASPESPGLNGSAKAGNRSRTRSSPSGKVNLNRASVEQFLGLAGVGPVTAQRIVDWRSQHGQFTAIDQLREVGGIGPAKFARLKDQVTL